MSEQEQQGYFLLIPGWIYERCTPTEAAVYGLINAMSQINNNGYSWMSAISMAKKLKIDERHVRRALASLEDQGLISRENSKGQRVITTPLPRGMAESARGTMAESAIPPLAESATPTLAESATQYKEYNNTKNKKESESSPPPPSKALPDPLEPFLEPAMAQLEEPTGSARWESNNQFVCAGRRPLKKYPEIFLTGPELAETFKQYTEAGIPNARWRNAFQMVQAKLRTPRLGGGSVSCFAWLTGWVKTDLMQQITNESRMQQQQARGAK